MQFLCHVSNFHKSCFLCYEYGQLIREKGCHVNSISLRLINDAETFSRISSIKLNKLLHPNCFDRKVKTFDLSLSVRVLFLFSLFFFYWSAQSKLNWKLFKILLNTGNNGNWNDQSELAWKLLIILLSPVACSACIFSLESAAVWRSFNGSITPDQQHLAWNGIKKKLRALLSSFKSRLSCSELVWYF